MWSINLSKDLTVNKEKKSEKDKNYDGNLNKLKTLYSIITIVVFLFNVQLQHDKITLMITRSLVCFFLLKHQIKKQVD